MDHTLKHLPLRPDYMETKQRRRDERSIERIYQHYLLERRLAAQLFNAPRSERAHIYGKVYSELFTSLPDHPQVTADRSTSTIALDLHYINVALAPGTRFLEVGCGDAEMSFAVAAKVLHAYGLDVTQELIQYERAPQNFSFLRTQSTDIALADDFIDIAYSNQLIEHLHPDDVADQMKEILRVLKPGGAYSCKTPSKITGPHDVSEYFDYQATGFHLCEYDYYSLRQLFRRCGFRKIHFFINARGLKIPFPYWLARPIEIAMITFPWLRKIKYFRSLMPLNIVGIK
ncbi:class I SAM-dependent methyltransferase [Janthinobacterium sp.]|uniref:class I SAM-dependent methyltransferase n=1 Tax=Janthinobacterium sp. TaxID=1871054 RepID=UPI0028A0A218|nr:class I SAM-dependent methyltransferase [Janthinobacterium sp.]